MLRAFLVAAVLALLLASPAEAGEATHRLQVNLELSIPTAPSGRARSLDAIEQGEATLRTVARNQRGGETVVVNFTLDYDVPKGTIAFDELVERIEVETAHVGGELFHQAVIDAQLIPLNPNRAKLFYRITLYYPTDAATYMLRVRLFGNYE